jgi:ABC-type Zn uptake system ZnuABC Zn-binding protein ZnuA
VRPSQARLLTALLAATLVLAACARDAADSGDGRLRVVATTTQVGALATAVGGEHIALTVLVAAGVDPHAYDPTATDVRALGRAALVLRNGLGLDAFLDKVIGSSGATRVVTVTEGVALAKGAGGADDPHVWFDIANDQVMADNVARALAAADPPHAAAYTANAAAYRAKLDEADRQIRAIIDTIPPANRKLVTNHDAFGYFIRRYGLTFVGAVIPVTGGQGEPSARDLAALEETIRAEGVRAIFAENSVDPKIATRIANDTGVRIVDDLYGDSLGPPGSGADTIEGMLLANARTIAEALR